MNSDSFILIYKQSINTEITLKYDNKVQLNQKTLLHSKLILYILNIAEMMFQLENDKTPNLRILDGKQVKWFVLAKRYFLQCAQLLFTPAPKLILWRILKECQVLLF